MEKSAPSGNLFSLQAARRVRELREELRWSRERLAQELAKVGQPLGQNGIYKIEQDPPVRRLTVDELGALAVVLRTTPHELMGWDKIGSMLGWDELTSSQEFERRFAEGYDADERRRVDQRLDAAEQAGAAAVQKFDLDGAQAVDEVVGLTGPELAREAERLLRRLEDLAPVLRKAAAQLAHESGDTMLVLRAHGYVGDDGLQRLVDRFGPDVSLEEAAARLQQEDGRPVPEETGGA